MGKYIAKQSVGKFRTGDEVKGLSDERIKQLVELDAVTVEQGEDDEIKPINKMKVDELQDYITANDGECQDDDKKETLLILAQEIESKLNDNEE